MFKKLKSIFIVEEEGGADNQKSVESKPESGGSGDSTKSGQDFKIDKPVFTTENPPKGKLNEKFVNRLLKAIEDNNIKGFDYLEYKQALQNLSNVEMDEATKFQSALAVAKTMGANKAILVSSAELYLKVLNDEEVKFVDAFKNQISVQVTAKNNAIKEIQLKIEQKKKEIKKLENEIEAQTKSLDEKRNSIDQAKAKVESTKDGFYQAYHVVSEQIKADLTKIKEYLK